MRLSATAVTATALVLAATAGMAQQDQRLRRTSGTQWFAGSYEVECEVVSQQRGVVMTVYGIARDDRQALLEARRNAVRAVIFKGIRTEVCDAPQLMRPEQMTPEADAFFQRFFAQGGQYLTYIEAAGDEVTSRSRVGGDVKIGSSVVVNHYRLRRDLESAGILSAMAAGLAAQRPRLMVFPKRALCIQKGAATEVQLSGGRTVRVCDYTRLFEQARDVREVISTIEGLFNDRGFPLENLAATNERLTDEAARRATQRLQTEGAAGEGLDEEILRTARPDIRLEVEWHDTLLLGQTMYTFQIDAYDAYTSQAVANATGSTAPTAGLSASVLLRAAVLQRMPQFESQLTDYFTSLAANGRLVRIRVEVERGFLSANPDGLETEIRYSRRNNEMTTLIDVIKDVIASGAVRRQVQFGAANEVSFEENVRIPLVGEDGNPIDAAGWAQNVIVRNLRLEGVVARAAGRELGNVSLVIRRVGASQ